MLASCLVHPMVHDVAAMFEAMDKVRTNLTTRTAHSEALIVRGTGCGADVRGDAGKDGSGALDAAEVFTAFTRLGLGMKREQVGAPFFAS